MCFTILHHQLSTQATWSLRSACGRWCRAVDAGASPPWTRDLGAFSEAGGPGRRLLPFWHPKGCPFWLTKIFGSRETMEVENHVCVERIFFEVIVQNLSIYVAQLWVLPDPRGKMTYPPATPSCKKCARSWAWKVASTRIFVGARGGPSCQPQTNSIYRSGSKPQVNPRVTGIDGCHLHIADYFSWSALV